MKLTNLLFLAATAWAIEPVERAISTSAPTSTQAGFNFAALSSALVNLANATEANFANISPPPKAMLQDIISVVPMPVMWELIDPQSRSSLAQQFSAGTTPAWYTSLPSDVKSYMTVVRAQISGGALTATTGLAYATTSAATGTATGGAATTASGAGSSSSSGMAAHPTALGSLIGAIGVLGLAVVL